MKIIGIDTSTRQGSVALTDNETPVEEITNDDSRSFSRSLLVMIDALLERRQLDIDALDAFALACGPGSFTGIRIGAATLLGIALSRNLPLYGVSTLEAAAYTAPGDGVTATVINAGRGSIYHALFRKKGERITRLTEDRLTTVADADLPAEAGVLYPDGEAIPGLEGYNRIEPAATTAAGVALAAARRLDNGERGEPIKIQPNYLHRGPVQA